ncbi:MAG: hypothetical protein JJ924_18180, partial [Roseitalea sp.]|nr:hypothetical protein [Roseitalea sp.]
MALTERQRKIALINELASKRVAYSGYNVPPWHQLIVDKAEQQRVQQRPSVIPQESIGRSDK